MKSPLKKSSRTATVLLVTIALVVWGFNARQLWTKKTTDEYEQELQLSQGLNLQERMEILKEREPAAFVGILWDPFLGEKPGNSKKAPAKKVVKKKKKLPFQISYVGLLEEKTGKVLFIFKEKGEFFFLHVGDSIGPWTFLRKTEEVLVFNNPQGDERSCDRK